MIDLIRYIDGIGDVNILEHFGVKVVNQDRDKVTATGHFSLNGEHSEENIEKINQLVEKTGEEHTLVFSNGKKLAREQMIVSSVRWTTDHRHEVVEWEIEMLQKAG